MFVQRGGGLRLVRRAVHLLILALMQTGDLDQCLCRLGVIRRGESVEVTPLTGGVSSDIRLVEVDGRRFCVKRALPRLKVAALWEAPVDRNAAEAWSVAKPAAPRSTAPSRLSRPARDPNATKPEELDAAADQFGRRAAWTDRRRQPRPERLRGDERSRNRG